MALITTSRQAPSKMQGLAKKLSELIPGSLFEQRGKKTLEQLVRLARKSGHSRLIIITSESNCLFSVQFIRLDEEKWEWMQEVINIQEFETGESMIVENLESTPELETLFEFESSPEGASLTRKGNTLCFSKGTNKLLEIKS